MASVLVAYSGGVDSAFLLAVSPLANLPELARHLLHCPCEVGQLPCDARYVLLGGHGLLPDSMGRKEAG